MNARIGLSGPSDRWEVAAFVANIFSERYRFYAYDNGPFDGTLSGVYGKPVTWGLTGTIRFGS